jgi:hypothetical protein
VSSHLFHVISSLLNCLRLASQDFVKLVPRAIRSIVRGYRKENLAEVVTEIFAKIAEVVLVIVSLGPSVEFSVRAVDWLKFRLDALGLGCLSGG